MSNTQIQVNEIFVTLNEAINRLSKLNVSIETQHEEVEVTFACGTVKVYTNKFVRGLFKENKVVLTLSYTRMKGVLAEFDREIDHNSTVKVILYQMEPLCTPDGYQELLKIVKEYLKNNMPRTYKLLRNESNELPAKSVLDMLKNMSSFKGSDDEMKLLETLLSSNVANETLAKFIRDQLRQCIDENLLQVIDM